MKSHTFLLQRCSAAEYADCLSKLEQLLPESVSFLQSPLYGRLQERDGKQVVYFVAKNTDTVPFACGIGVRYTAPGGLNFLYVPYGPVAKGWSTELVQSFQDFFAPLAKELDCTFVRLDPAQTDATSVLRPIPAKLARTASLQPRAEWLLDLTPSEDDIWASFHKHARYNVRLAERANATTTLFAPQDAPLDDFYKLMKATGARDNFGIFNKSYYQAYIDSLTNDEGYMVLTTIDGKPAATGLFVIHDKQAHYVFAGSSNDFRKIAPAYSVIWAALQEAKKRGCTTFNFGGIVDEVKGHDLGGVAGFKKRFGGYAITHQNPTDLIFHKTKYLAFRVYKKLHS